LKPEWWGSPLVQEKACDKRWQHDDNDDDYNNNNNNTDNTDGTLIKLSQRTETEALNAADHLTGSFMAYSRLLSSACQKLSSGNLDEWLHKWTSHWNILLLILQY